MSTRLPNPSYNAVSFESKSSTVLDTTVNGGTAQGRFGAIQILKDTTITALSGLNVENIAKLQTSGLAAGTVLYGVFTNITITSGLVVLHHV